TRAYDDGVIFRMSHIASSNSIGGPWSGLRSHGIARKPQPVATSELRTSSRHLGDLRIRCPGTPSASRSSHHRPISKAGARTDACVELPVARSPRLPVGRFAVFGPASDRGSDPAGAALVFDDRIKLGCSQRKILVTLDVRPHHDAHLALHEVHVRAV